MRIRRGAWVLSLALVALGTVAWRPVAADQVRFTADVEVVQLDVAVTRNGRTVRGLQPSDFEVRDNGVRQAITAVAFDRVPVSVMLALDMSSSVRGEKLEELRAAADSAFEALALDDTAAVLAFSDRVALRVPFTRDMSRLGAGLVGPLPPGDTALIDAVHTALVLCEERVGRPFVIVFSDGADTGSFLSVDLVLDTARRTRAVVYAVTTADAGSDGFLDEVVHLTGGRRFDAADDRSLAAVFAAVFSAARERYLISYMPEGVDGGGWHELTVHVPSASGSEVEARPGYLVVQ